MTLTCSKCDEVKDVSEFHKDASISRGYAYICKACKKVHGLYGGAPVRRDRDREYYHKHWMQYKYKISWEAYQEMLEAQGHVCAICEQVPTNKLGFHIDHDHNTGVVRGLLCHGCNTGIGALQEDPKLLQRAAEYLEGRL
jgi:hypothetical protein